MIQLCELTSRDPCVRTGEVFSLFFIEGGGAGGKKKICGTVTDPCYSDGDGSTQVRHTVQARTVRTVYEQCCEEQCFMRG
jgi:hypothetical protein